MEKVNVLSFFGPPGTGKGTVAQRLVDDLGYIMLSTGNLARMHIQEQTALGKTFQEYVNKGHLIPDDLITQMVLEWLKEQVAKKKTIILDGFPRTKGQASLLLDALKNDPNFAFVLFKVINFELDEAEIVKRISSRLVCSNKSCQAVYSTLVKPPKNDNICDECGTELSHRHDDKAEVVLERLKVFAKFKDDLLAFYKQAGQEVITFPIPEGGPDVVYKAFREVL